MEKCESKSTIRIITDQAGSKLGMRVLQVIDSLHWGGVQELLVTLATAARNSDISLCVASLRAYEDTPYQHRLERLGVTVCTFPARKLLDVRRIWAVFRFMRDESFDLVHTHLMYADIVGGFAALMNSIPAIATLHVPSIDQNPLRRQINTWVLRNLMQRVIAVGPSVAETYSQDLKNTRIQVIPNAVNVPPQLAANDRRKIRSEIAGETEGPILITIGRLDQAKGYEDLIAAMIPLRRMYPSLRLLIAGAGEFYSALQEQIHNHGLSEHVYLLGGRNDVPRLLSASDIYVSASHIEGMSISILEAMAAGLPVIATCVGENSKLILPNTGILVPPKNAQALAEAISTLIKSPQMRASFGAGARSLIRNHHNVESWFAQIRTLYKEVVEGKS